jgi:hypothetical protein
MRNAYKIVVGNPMRRSYCSWKTRRRWKYSTPSPFAGVTFLKTPANCKTAMREVKSVWEKWG